MSARHPTLLLSGQIKIANWLWPIATATCDDRGGLSSKEEGMLDNMESFVVRRMAEISALLRRGNNRTDASHPFLFPELSYRCRLQTLILVFPQKPRWILKPNFPLYKIYRIW